MMLSKNNREHEKNQRNTVVSTIGSKRCRPALSKQAVMISDRENHPSFWGLWWRQCGTCSAASAQRTKRFAPRQPLEPLCSVLGFKLEVPDAQKEASLFCGRRGHE